MIDFVGRRRFYAVFSLLMVVPSLIGLALWQFEAGLDFAGGLETEVRFLGDTDLDAVSAAVADAAESEDAPDGLSVEATEGEDGAFLVTANLNPGSSEDSFAVSNLISSVLSAGLPSRVDLDVEVTDSEIRNEFWFPGNVTQDEVRGALESVGLGGARIQATADSAFRLRVEQPLGR